MRLTDDLFEALSHRHRRCLLSHLLEVEQQNIPSIVEELHRGQMAPEHVRLELLHNHLPKLEACGFIDWNPQSNVVVRGPNFEDIDPYLRHIYDHRDSLPTDWD